MTVRVAQGTRQCTSIEVYRQALDWASRHKRLDDSAAMAIAAQWQAPRGTGMTLAVFASGYEVHVADLVADITATIQHEQPKGLDFDALRALQDWAETKEVPA